MASYARFCRQAPFWRCSLPVLPILTAQASKSNCDGSASSASSSEASDAEIPLNIPKFGMKPNEVGDFHKLFPKRQLWQPKLKYPLWDKDWDDKHPPSLGSDQEDRLRSQKIRSEGVTRHIILVRHGQYDEDAKEDSQRLLTELGRRQADLTGMRLREMLQGATKEFGPCKIKVVRVSDMARAKETADIIASHLPGVEYADPDPDLNEGRPAHTIPGGRASASVIEKTDAHHGRIETAFRRYFYRAPFEPTKDKSAKEKSVQEKHEFEVIVCHANVIRYFLLRALQLPPEAWLRLCTFNCSLTYLTIRPTGSVSCRMLGDVGHIPYGMTTFSKHTGFNW